MKSALPVAAYLTAQLKSICLKRRLEGWDWGVFGEIGMGDVAVLNEGVAGLERVVRPAAMMEAKDEGGAILAVKR